MQQITFLINQLFEIKQKLIQDKLIERYERNFNRLFNTMDELGYLVKDPLGEKYTDSRTDCEANIVGEEAKNMLITKVIKPIVYQKNNGNLQLVQKGVVMVEKSR